MISSPSDRLAGYILSQANLLRELCLLRKMLALLWWWFCVDIVIAGSGLLPPVIRCTADVGAKCAAHANIESPPTHPSTHLLNLTINATLTYNILKQIKSNASQRPRLEQGVLGSPPGPPLDSSQLPHPMPCPALACCPLPYSTATGCDTAVFSASSLDTLAGWLPMTHSLIRCLAALTLALARA